MKKLLASIAFILSACCALAQSSGPINTPMLNKAYYFVGTSPYTTTIQSAVNAACAAGHGEVVVAPGVTPADSPTAVTGCSNVGLVVQTVLPWACYASSGGDYSSTSCAGGSGGTCAEGTCVVNAATGNQVISQADGTYFGVNETLTANNLGNGLLQYNLAANAPGWNFGNNGTSAQGWSVNKLIQAYVGCLQSGICQLFSVKMTATGKGDKAAFYSYLTTFGGTTDASGEAITHTVAHNDQVGYFSGQIATGGTTGSTLITTTGFGCHGYCVALETEAFSQGGMMLDWSQPGATLQLADQGNEIGAIYYDLGGGSTVTRSSAWGEIVPGTCSPNGNGQTPLTPSTLTCNVNLNTSPSSPADFASGSDICLAGNGNQEQAPVTAAPASSGGVQTITFSTIYAWNAGVVTVMQGGLCGQSLVAATGSWPVAYQILGATSTTRIDFSNCLKGGCGTGGNTIRATPGSSSAALSRNGSGTVTITPYPFVFGLIYSIPVGSQIVISGCVTHPDLDGTFTVLTNTLDYFNAMVTYAQSGASETDNSCLVSQTPTSVTVYPMAFIVGNDNGTVGAANLMHNSVPFVTGDTVVGAPTSEWQGATFTAYQGQTTAVDPSTASGAYRVSDDGPSPMYYAYQALNNAGNGVAPYMFDIEGSYKTLFNFKYRPGNNGTLLYVTGNEPVSSNAKPYYIFQDNQSSGKMLFYPTSAEVQWSGPWSATSVIDTSLPSEPCLATDSVGTLIPCSGGGGGTPTVAVGGGAGSGATVSISGTNQYGAITFNTGASAVTGPGVLFIITFSPAYATAPKGCLIQSTNLNAATSVAGTGYPGVPTTTTEEYAITSTFSLGASQPWTFYYSCN